MERYTAYRHLIRISHADEAILHMAAEELAIVTSERWNMKGANVTFGRGLWDGVYEFGATVEIVTREPRTNEDMQILRNHVTAMGLTAYVTVDTLAAHELY